MEDPRGWFQWSCRYTVGRRIPKIDEIQQKDGKILPDMSKRLKKITRGFKFRRRQRQAILQWAYNPFI